MSNTPNPNRKRWTLAGAGAAAGLTAGLVLGGLGIAGAATSGGSTSTTTPAASSTAPSAPSGSSSAPPSMPAHGSAAHEDAETPVTGSAATQAQAAAVKYVGSGTAGAVTTDFPKSGYEVTVTKADGTQVEVHLDSSFTVMQGGPGGGHHGPDGDGPGAPPPPSSSSSSTTAG